MRKGWHIVSGIAMICVLLGIAGIGVGFFTGGSPTAIQNHGGLTGYVERLMMNWDIIRGMIGF